LRAAPLLGADTDAVLTAELGLDAGAIAELRMGGAIA
jgi:crotonobetainyl-CoA:carnitine CoA-transferase CaiB-like acyl-CoA transferase